jgi:hypothetical protein
LEAELAVKFGLDAETIALLDRMPGTMRAEVVEGMRQALGMLDVSVDRYLKEIDLLLDKQIDAVACSVDGRVITLGDELQKLGGKAHAPTRDVSRKWERLQKSAYGRTATPLSIRLGYADLIDEIAGRLCNVGARPSRETEAELKELQDRIGVAWRTWRRMGESCASPRACVLESQWHAEEVIQRDPRDSTAVNAAALLAEMEVPVTDKAWKTRWWMDLRPFEKAMAHAHQVEDLVAAARAKRIRDANALVEPFKAPLAAELTTIANAGVPTFTRCTSRGTQEQMLSILGGNAPRSQTIQAARNIASESETDVDEVAALHDQVHASAKARLWYAHDEIMKLWTGAIRHSDRSRDDENEMCGDHRIAAVQRANYHSACHIDGPRCNAFGPR